MFSLGHIEKFSSGLVTATLLHTPFAFCQNKLEDVGRQRQNQDGTADNGEHVRGAYCVPGTVTGALHRFVEFS